LLAGPSRGLRLAVLAAASLALMVADHRQQYLGVVRDWLSIAVYPVHWLVDAPSSAWRFASETLATQRGLEQELARLETENRELRLRLLRFDALEQENLRLREARTGSARVAERSLVAEILRVDLDPFRQRVLVNKGSKQDVFVGQAALDATGVFGQVTRVGPISAEIIMISDRDHAIPVQVNRTGVRTIAVGQGQTGSLLLPYLPSNADIAEGDLVVTSGLGGVFPPGYPVAEVSVVRRDPAEPLLEVTATPTARLDRDPEVLLVWFDNRIVEPVEETTGDAATPSPADPATPPGDPPPAASDPGPGAAPTPVAGG
jgi:rod shape-determining protein MreC